MQTRRGTSAFIRARRDIYYGANPYLKSLSLIGMSKNAGKTTVLNALLEFYFRRRIVLGLTSVGRDGEDRDIVTNTDKPRIYIKNGTIFATAASMLPLCDVTREILSATGINTPLGEVIILRARTDGYAQLAGPSINAQITGMCDTLRGFGAHTVIVDGAFARKTLASPAVTENTILCAGASLGRNMRRVVDETRHVHDLLRSEKINAELARLTDGFPLAVVDEKGLCTGFEQSALTGALANDLIMGGKRSSIIVAEDASKLLISAEIHRKLLLHGVKIQVRTATKLLAVTVNPVSAYGYAFDADAFQNALASEIETPVINVMREGAALYDLLV
jgi:hypothetical protein